MEPERAGLFSNRLLDEQQDAPGELDVGWITYVRGADAHALPPSARAELWEAGVAVELGTALDAIPREELVAVRRAFA